MCTVKGLHSLVLLRTTQRQWRIVILLITLVEASAFYAHAYDGEPQQVGVAPGELSQNEGGERPVCRIHFIKNWSDTNAPDGAVPTSEFSQAIVKVFNTVGVTLEPAPFVPWTRAVESVMRGRDHGLSVALKTPERLDKLEFLGPIFISDWGAFRSLKHEYNEMARPKIGIPAQFSYLTPVQDAIDAMGGEAINMSLPRLERMLDEGLIDLIFGPRVGLKAIDDAVGRTVAEVPSLTFQIHSYVAIRKDAPCIQKKEALSAAIVAWSQTEEAQQYNKPQ